MPADRKNSYNKAGAINKKYTKSYDKSESRSDEKRYGKSEDKRYGKSEDKRYGKPEDKRYGKSEDKKYGRPSGDKYGKSDDKRYGKSEDKRYGKSEDKKYGRPSGDKYGKSDDKRYGKSEDKRYGKPEDKKYGRPSGDKYGKSEDKRYGKPDDKRYGKPEEKRYGKSEDKKYSRPSGDKYGKSEDKRYGKPEDKRYGKSEDKKYGRPGGDKYGKSEDKRYGKPEDKRYGKPEDKRYGKPEDKRYGKSEDKRYGKFEDKKNYDSDDKQLDKVDISKLTICEQCGGCLGQTESYEKHILKKQKQLQKALGEYCTLDPMMRMEDPYYYRNKVFAVFHHEKTGPVCGVYNSELRKVVPMNECAINSQKATAIIGTIRDLLKSFKIKTYDPRTEHGLLRYVLVREAKATGEIMVVLVLSSNIMPSKNNFVKALRKVHPEIDTIIINENYKATEKVLGDKETTIFGKGFIIDSIADKNFRVSSKSLYPVNTIQTEALCKKVIEFADCTKADILLDAYCGIGTIGIIASDYVKKVISIDSKPEAIRDAVSNSKRNQIKNVDFYTNDAAEFVNQVVESEKQKPNIVVMDPPKSGSNKEFLQALVDLNPEKVIYVSRNVNSLANDLRYLINNGYQVKRATGVDMLPWTDHVETVVLLSN